MTAKTFTRSAIVAMLAGVAALAGAPAANAVGNAEAERYVQEHASAALRALGDERMTEAQRQQAFYRLMAQFSDMPRIAVWVLGRYGDQLRDDPALRAEWTSAFQDYAIATYESRLSNFSGSNLRVVGSSELAPGRAEVTSEIVPVGQNRPLVVRWQINRAGQAWRVFDVQVRADNGDAIWLGQRQRTEFLVELERNRGDVRALTRRIRELTAVMRQRVAQRR